MTTIYVPRGQTVTSDGTANLILTGKDTAKITVPSIAPPFQVDSFGNNDLTVNGPSGPGVLRAEVFTTAGTLTFHGSISAGSTVSIEGSGKLLANVGVGGGRGVGSMTVGVNDQGSTYDLVPGGRLELEDIKFLKQADAITLNDGGSPAANIVPTPSLIIDDVPELKGASFGPNGLRLDYAAGGHATFDALHIYDPQFYSLTQQANGDVTIQATAFASGGQVTYVPPATPPGGHVFHI